MMQFFTIHPENPQLRLIRAAVHVVQDDGIIVYPTDSGYALGCRLGSKMALKRIQRIRQLEETHNMTLVCRDLSDLGSYARVNNQVFRLLKALTPGPYTFVLHASKEVPRLMLQKRKTLGFRVPDHPVALALLEELNAPMMSTSLLLPEAQVPLCEPAAIRDVLGSHVDSIIDVGHCQHEPTTVVDLTEEIPKILRHGKGDTAPFGI